MRYECPVISKMTVRPYFDTDIEEVINKAAYVGLNTSEGHIPLIFLQKRRWNQFVKAIEQISTYKQKKKETLPIPQCVVLAHKPMPAEHFYVRTSGIFEGGDVGHGVHVDGGLEDVYFPITPDMARAMLKSLKEVSWM